MKCMRIFLIFTMLLAFSISIIGCDDDSSSPTMSKGTLTTPPFVGAWTLVSMNGQPITLERPITANFADGSISGFSGCNFYSGSYQYYVNGTDGSRLYVSSQLIMTLMACEPAIMQLESDYLRILQMPLADEYDGGSNLTLKVENGQQLVYVRE